MSELKEHRFITTDELFHDANAGALYYDKSEADKVIAEKDKELRRHKYRRCLAMSKICENKLGTVVKPAWWGRWRRRWLELAEKFKEAK